MNMKARIVNFYKEIELQLRILFEDGRRELKIYRLERNHGMSLLWVPSKGSWVRARAYQWGFKYVRVRFVDGGEKTGKRSPLSCRTRDPRARGRDMPWVDARCSGNSVCRLPWYDRLRGALMGPGNAGATIEEVKAALITLRGAGG